MQDICLSGGAIAVISPIVTALVAAIGILWREMLKSKDAQISEWKRLAERATETSGKAVRLAAGGDL